MVSNAVFSYINMSGQPDNIAGWNDIREFRLSWVMAVMCAKELGYNINLYIDPAGYDQIKFLNLPFDYVEFIDPSRTFPEDYACVAKFMAYEDMLERDEPFVYLDFDYYLFQPVEFDGQLAYSYTESLSDRPWYNTRITELENHGISHPLFDKENQLESFNCGLLGFKDLNFLAEYVNEYYSQMDLIHNSDLFPYWEYGMVAEQYMLASLAKHKSVKYKPVHPNVEFPWNPLAVHALGDNKRNGSMAGFLEGYVRSKFYDYYVKL